MPIGFVAVGTKETVHVDFEDTTGLITSLAGSGPTFTVKDAADVNKVTDAGATASGMRISCLVDTNVGGVWAEGEYRLFVKFTVGAEVIVKGPYYFIISNS
jgi:hypothetical protein